LEADLSKLLKVFQSKVRIEIVKLLLRLEWVSLSDISKELKSEFGLKITLPGLLKHMKELENAGIVRHESGVFAEKPDARKTIYILEGKERVERLLHYLEDDVKSNLVAGKIFSEAYKLARKIQGVGRGLSKKEMMHLESLLAQCESEEVRGLLTEDEKKKMKLWRMMMNMLLKE
jgi:DNA-binding transcriptional ArsR family regulator